MTLPRLTERLREPSENHKISVKAHALDAAHSEEREAVVVLQAAELALDGGTGRPTARCRA